MSDATAWDVIVVGAGPAGMLAACRAAEHGRRCLLLEKNRRAGVKILMSGGTRCNLTHNTDVAGIVKAFGPPGRFLHSALAALGPRQLVELIEMEGVPTKVEPGGKIFPASDRAADVCDALLRRLKRSGCSTAYNEPLQAIQRETTGFALTTPARTLRAANVILALGGQSYPGCGTCGDGYRLAAALGHRIVQPRVALVPITTTAAWVHELQGVTLADVLVRIAEHPPAGAEPAKPKRDAALAEYRGGFLFTHFGLSGPAVLNVSRAVSGHPDRRRLAVVCDFLPDVSEAALEAQLRAACSGGGKRQIGGIVGQWLPQRLAEALLVLANVDPASRAAEFPKAARQQFLAHVKRMAIPVSGTLGFEKAEVTAGGVALEEVDSRTLQSKLVPGLYLIGELLDLDGPIGGYNFQAAFSTGWLAGAVGIRD